MAFLARQDQMFDGAIFHITWKCHNDDFFLEDDDIKQLYYDLLLKYKYQYGVEFYSYSLMSNHPHLCGRTRTAIGISNMLRNINSQLAKAINKKYGRRGQAIMDRFTSPIIRTDRDLLAVMTYDDTNCFRTSEQIHPDDYKWSSYRHYAHGEPDPLITPAPSYLALGDTPEMRQAEYRLMVQAIMDDGMEKQNYSKVLYIGDPDWVKQKYEEIMEIKREKRVRYLKRRYEMLREMAPP